MKGVGATGDRADVLGPGEKTGSESRAPDWAGLVAEAVATGPASSVTVVESRLVGSSVELVFVGDPGFRAGLFGVRFQVPAREGDARWQAMAEPAAPKDWAWIAAIVEVMTPYEAVSEAEIAAPDAAGVRWLQSSERNRR